MKPSPARTPATSRAGAPLIVRARAKVNLRLEVGGRREDGFHEVRTLMHTLRLADCLRLEVSAARPDVPTSPGRWPDDRVTVDCFPETGISGARNLAHRAASLYLRTWAQLSPQARRVEVAIAIEKRIPVAAGLGGGSADAAATLRGLAGIFGPQGGPCGDDLSALARRIGADVPFCLSGGAAWGAGRGDELSPVRSALTQPVLIAVPQTAVRSADAYTWWDETERPTRQGEEEPFRPPYMLTAPSVLPALVANALRPPVARRLPLVDELVSAVHGEGALAGEMSGSGAAVFGVFADQVSAVRAMKRLAGRFGGTNWIRTRLAPECERIFWRDRDGR